MSAVQKQEYVTPPQPKRRRGRPVRADGPTSVLGIRLTQDDRKLLEWAAAGKPMSEWVRETLLGVARELRRLGFP